MGNILKEVIRFFASPVSRIQKNIDKEKTKLAVVFILLISFVAGLVPMIAVTRTALEPYNENISDARESYRESVDALKEETEDRKERAKERGTEFDPESVSFYEDRVDSKEERLGERREERMEFVKEDLVKLSLRAFWYNFLRRVLLLGLLTVGLFVFLKIFNSNGNFTETLIGVGTTSLIFLVPDVVVPLLQRIPNLEFLGYVSLGIPYIIGFLLYSFYKENDNMSENNYFVSLSVSLVLALILSHVITPGVEEIGILTSVNSMAEQMLGSDLTNLFGF